MRILLCVFLAFFSLSVNSKPKALLGVRDVIGKIIYIDAGSGMASFLMSTKIEVKGRNLIEMKFLYGAEIFSSPNVNVEVVTNEQDLTSLMINCKELKYSVFDKEKQDAYSFRIYSAGKNYSWTDHKSEGAIPIVFERDDLQLLFKNACAYTGQY